MSAQFRKKPVVIEAVQYQGGGNFADPLLPSWIWEALESGVVFNRQGDLIIKTLEGEHLASPGDWIIRGVKGELYPCKPDIFAATYEPAAAPAPLASPAAQEWQPIETAPKDGTEILLTNGKTVAEGQWCDEEPYIREYRDADGRWIDQQESDGFEGWMDWSGGMKPDPTHWMPLPPAPTMSATPPAGER